MSSKGLIAAADSSDAKVVLTLAMSKLVYFSMAINLARSFLWWHRQSDIRFCIVTDLAQALPKDLSQIELVRIAPGKLGKGFSAKLHLDEVSPIAKTLFIDADCLIVGNLDSVFARFQGRPVGVVGGSIAEGEWFGDVAALCAHFGVPSLPKFNGGIYYLEPGAISTAVYRRARELERDYDQVGLKRLRGRANDELLMAIAMALHELKALPDDGTIMSDPQACPGGLEVNVLGGRSRLVNPREPDPLHQAWYPHHVVHPLVVHFLGDYTSQWQYRAEAKKQRLVMAQGWPVFLAEGIVGTTFSTWHVCQEKIKEILRPWYRKVFGARPIKKSNRI
jgi:hypothetical protein